MATNYQPKEPTVQERLRRAVLNHKWLKSHRWNCIDEQRERQILW
jgi:hypothetical protein